MSTASASSTTAARSTADLAMESNSLGEQCGVTVVFTGQGRFPKYIVRPLRTLNSPSIVWTPLALSIRLGMALNFTTEPYHTSYSACDHISEHRCHTLEFLSMDCDPESPQFNQPAHFSCGRVTFKLDSGDDLTQAHIQVMESYVAQHLGPMRDLMSKGSKDHAKVIYAKMQPKNFAMFMRTLWAAMAERYNNSAAWSEIPIPVRVDPPACFSCSAETTEDGAGQLKKCGKCKVAYYCSGECQKEDWSIHKHRCAVDVAEMAET